MGVGVAPTASPELRTKWAPRLNAIGKRICELNGREPIPIRACQSTRGALGTCYGDGFISVAVQECNGMERPELDILETLIHELAHYTLHHGTSQQTTQSHGYAHSLEIFRLTIMLVKEGLL